MDAQFAARLADQVRRIRREAERIEAVADSRDGLIRATVDGRGRLIELDLNPRIFRNPDSRALSDAIVGTMREAQQSAEREITRLWAAPRRTR